MAEDSVITKKQVSNLTLTGSRKGGAMDGLMEDTDTFQDFKESAERLFLLRKLEEHDWNISQTAEAIDIQRSHIYNKIKKYNIER
ncbi:MAG: helix-turn-helix domain-containing protein [Fodinibius sp.]|nr:helix-turn-helix domain-containing protein [Fodinibius sp.]